jgi:membrane protein YqaA with SNARE-associated domain
MASDSILHPSRLRRTLDFTPVRLVLAVFAASLAGGLTTAFVGEAWQRRFHEGWPRPAACSRRSGPMRRTYG